MRADESVTKEQIDLLNEYHRFQAERIAEVEAQMKSVREAADATAVTREAALLAVFVARVSDVNTLLASTHLGFKTEYAARAMDRVDESSRGIMRATWGLVAATSVLALVTGFLVFYTRELALTETFSPPSEITEPATGTPDAPVR